MSTISLIEKNFSAMTKLTIWFDLSDMHICLTILQARGYHDASD